MLQERQAKRGESYFSKRVLRVRAPQSTTVSLSVQKTADHKSRDAWMTLPNMPGAAQSGFYKCAVCALSDLLSKHGHPT